MFSYITKGKDLFDVTECVWKHTHTFWQNISNFMQQWATEICSNNLLAGIHHEGCKDVAVYFEVGPFVLEYV